VAVSTKGVRVKRAKLILWVLVPVVVATAFILAVSGALPYKLSVVHTGSMSPTISSRSAVIVREHQFRVGEPISFTADGTVITHRLVGINADGTITTKGDANTTPDPWHVPTSAIIGGVVAAPAELGYWMMYLKNPVGLLSILASALLLWQIWSLAGDQTRTPRDLSSNAGGARIDFRHRRVGGSRWQR
jgi:signal peptidase